ncbi:hypothetical protein ABVT39_003248 [Epinephelus coioides]
MQGHSAQKKTKKQKQKTCLIISEDMYSAPQGVAAAVRLPEELAGWFQVPNSAPHVTLMIAEGYESHHLGPMVRCALQVREWLPNRNKYIHISDDKQYSRISIKTGDKAVTDKVLVDGTTPTQMAVTEEHAQFHHSYGQHIKQT